MYSIIICLKIILNINFLTIIVVIDCLYVSVGNYSDNSKYGVNDWECGLRYVPNFYTITRPPNCFFKSVGTTNYTMFSKLTHSFEQKSETIRQRIKNGMNAEVGEAPWTVYLNCEVIETITHPNFPHRPIAQKSDYYICTGSLITLNWVLTAAHCLREESTEVKIYAGSNKPNAGIIIRIDKSKWFKNLNFTFGHPEKYQYDLALVNIGKSFVRKEYNGHYLINTICLPNKNQYNLDEENATFFGFGKTQTNREADHLQKGQVTLMPHNCTYLDKIICALGSDSQNITGCAGDSGGPLLQYSGYEMRAIQIAVMKAGGPSNKPCSEQEITNWISVSLHMDWILETISSND